MTCPVCKRDDNAFLTCNHPNCMDGRHSPGFHLFKVEEHRLHHKQMLKYDAQSGIHFEFNEEKQRYEDPTVPESGPTRLIDSPLSVLVFLVGLYVGAWAGDYSGGAFVVAIALYVKGLKK